MDVTNTRLARERSSDGHPVRAAPPAEHVNGPDARPVEAGRPGQERVPEPADGARVEAGSLAEPAVVQGGGHLFLERVAGPAVDREHETGLGPVEERRVEITQG